MEIMERAEDFVGKGSGLIRSKWDETGKPHVTRIIRDIEAKLSLSNRGPGFEDMELTREVGFLWEELLSMVFANRMVVHPVGEIEKDGIVGSPDGVGEDPVHPEYESSHPSCA